MIKRVERFMKLELKYANPIAEALSRLLYPFAEVALHDLEKDRIEAIYNPFSKREVGDNSYLDRLNFDKNLKSDVIGPYEKLNYDGRKLKSISVVLRNELGDAKGFLCVNMDISVFENYQNVLTFFLKNADKSVSEERESFFKDDLYDQINRFVQNYCRNKQVVLENLSRREKQILVFRLKEKGAFNGKNASRYIARIFGISRATVYNYLNDLSEGKCVEFSLN